MSVISKNPFDLLGDDGDESPAPVSKPAAKKADAPAAAPARNVPGAGAKPSGEQGRGAGGERGRGRGNYPNRGAPRNVYRGDGSGGGGGDDAPQRNTGPTSSEGVAQGFETPGGFDGERVAPSRKGNHVRDAHTKGPRGTRPAKNLTSGGHTSSRSNRDAAHTPAQGGERRQFERRSGGIPDSQKKVDQGWGANEGEAELTAEVEGERDAVVEEKTGADDGPDVVEADAAADATAAAAPAEVDPDENNKGLDAYLAERAAAAFEYGKKEGRQVNAESLEGQEFRRQGVEEFFAAKKETTTKSAKAPKKEKVYIEFDGQFATPPGGGGDRPFRGGDRAERGGRGGGNRGGRGGDRGGRGRGAPRGAGGPRGAPRGAASGGARGGRAGQANLDSNDQTAFPALGA